VQYAVRDGLIYVLEANPRASRTVPFVSKATGVPLAKVATWAMMGLSFEQMAERGFITTQTATRYEISQLQGGESVAINLYRAYRMDSKSIAVKEAVLPFDRFPDADSLLGPEMRSTGEVMGISDSFGLSFAKSQIAAGNRLPSEGAIFLSLADRDKKLGGEVAGEFVELGFRIFATKGTAIYLASIGVPVEKTIAKLTDPNGGQLESEPNFGDPIQLISNAAVSLIINTPRGRGARADGAYIRKAASAYGVPCITTIAAARAAISGIRAWSESSIAVRSLQELIASGKDVAGDPSDR
jgi:carbamoyl-phosphate synthase large subunit